jgi:hypothetical protein
MLTPYRGLHSIIMLSLLKINKKVLVRQAVFYVYGLNPQLPTFYRCRSAPGYAPRVKIII